MASSDSEMEFAVTEILKQRKRKGIVEYLVRWDGYDDDDDSWEPANSLTNCVDQLKKFVQSQDAMKRRRSRARSKGRARSKSRGRSRGRSKSASRKTTKSIRSVSKSHKEDHIIVSSDEEDVPIKPKRQSRRTEILARNKTDTIPGGFETSSSVIKMTTVEDDTDMISTEVVIESKEITTIENHKTSDLNVAISTSDTPFFAKLWNQMDAIVLLLFICISVVLVSFIMEKYFQPQEIWTGIVNACKMTSTYIKTQWSALGSSAARTWNVTTTFLQTSWKSSSGSK